MSNYLAPNMGEEKVAGATSSLATSILSLPRSGAASSHSARCSPKVRSNTSVQSANSANKRSPRSAQRTSQEPPEVRFVMENSQE